jgi:lysophospholipase L1-like esterase
MQIVLKHMPVDIVYIGDSITGQYATDVYFGEYGRLINRGYGGERMQELGKRFESDALALKPRLVILASGINDTIPFYQKFKNGEEITETDKHKYLVETRIAYRQALEKAREAGIPLWIATILPLGTKDFRTDFLMANNEQIKKLCKEYDTVCLDYHAQMIQDDGRTFIKDMHFGDDLHPHVKGYNVLSGIAKEQLKKENF